MALEQGDLVQRELLWQGVYEPEISKFLQSELDAKDVFMDIGANCGYHSLHVAASTGCRVTAFEPDPEMIAAFKFNLALNPKLEDLIQIRPEAISAVNGYRTFYRSAASNSGMSGFSARNAVASFEVSTRTLVSLVEEGVVPMPTVMKIDVEGHEAEVFLGAGRLIGLPQLRCIIFEAAPGENDLPRDMSLVSSLRDYGFEVQRIGVSGYLETENYLAKRRGRKEK